MNKCYTKIRFDKNGSISCRLENHNLWDDKCKLCGLEVEGYLEFGMNAFMEVDIKNQTIKINPQIK